MSYSEVYKLKQNGEVVMIGEVVNSFRGAMAIWNTLDLKYLPKYIPEWTTRLKSEFIKPDKVYYRSSDETEIQKVWDLTKHPEITETDKVCLIATFDDIIFSKGVIPELVDAFKDFEGNTSLPEIATIIEKAYAEHEDLEGIAFNWTSVNGDAWEDENGEPYNINTGTKHDII